MQKEYPKGKRPPRRAPLVGADHGATVNVNSPTADGRLTHLYVGGCFAIVGALLLTYIALLLTHQEAPAHLNQLLLLVIGGLLAGSPSGPPFNAARSAAMSILPAGGRKAQPAGP